jgi:ribonuclease E
MREERHRRGVERELREAVKRDRARTKILRMSHFGLIEMTRQRIRPSLRRSVYEDCPCCQGAGQVKTTESVAIEAIRLLITAAHREDSQQVIIEVEQHVADFLNNRKRKEITRIEDEANVTVRIAARNEVSPEHMIIKAVNASGTETKISVLADS